MNAGLLKVCLGVGSPWDLRPFMERLGVEVIPFAQRNRCSVFADFVGARPPIDRLLTIFRPGHEKGQGDLVTDSAEAAASALYSKALGLDLFITATPEMFNVLCSVSALRAGRAAVCLRGENGTGRRFLASILHAASGLSSSASGKINTFYPATDAGAPILDALVAASRYGTLVVYEPEKLRRQAQHQIAKIIESDDAALPRIICVTSAGVDDLADDLRWTLNNAVFDIQPLRLRRNDISLLSGHFLNRRNPKRTFSQDAIKKLKSYVFPGNIRELKAIVARLASDSSPGAKAEGVIDDRMVERALSQAIDPATAGKTIKLIMGAARRDALLGALAASGGNRKMAAKNLGISLRTFQYHMKLAGLVSIRSRRAA